MPFIHGQQAVSRTVCDGPCLHPQMSYRPLTFVVLCWLKDGRWQMCIWVGNLTLNCIMETPKYIWRLCGMLIALSFRTDNQKRVAGQCYCSKICTLHQLHLHSSGFQPVFLVPSTTRWRIVLAAIIWVWSQVRKKLQHCSACVWNASAVEEIMIQDHKCDSPIKLKKIWLVCLCKSKIFLQNYILIVTLLSAWVFYHKYPYIYGSYSS